MKERIKAILPNPVLENVRSMRSQAEIAMEEYSRLISRISMSHGIDPINRRWVKSRGLEVHRLYTLRFIEKNSGGIQGHGLEFSCDEYSSKCSRGNISRLDIIHLDQGNPKATIVADLTKPNQIKDDTFDFIICTYTLHIIFDLRTFVSELHRILKPGGVLLVVVPGISWVWPGAGELWHFTTEGLAKVLGTAFSTEKIHPESYGNSLTACGDLRGLIAAEFRKEELEANDPNFQLVVCARAEK